MFENIECGPCNDGICDWMPCSFPNMCKHDCPNPKETEMSNKKTVEAVETEAKDLDVEFEYSDGETYVFPPARKWPLEVIEAQENMKLMKFTKELLGEDQFATLRKTVKTVGDLDDFITKLFEHLDVDKGK